MSEIELPEGITFNETLDDSIELETISEVVNSTKCQLCDFVVEAVLITHSGRHEGVLRAVDGNVLWKNSLPKDTVRSIKLLNDTLITKLNVHAERHAKDGKK
jgi:hypothetical protein